MRHSDPTPGSVDPGQAADGGPAADAALAAARRAGVVVREVHSLEDLRRACELLTGLWGTQQRLFLPAELARALSHAGNYFAVAEAPDGGDLQAALVGFIGISDGGYHLQSHVLGVLPPQRRRGVGFALKLHQRAWALERGLTRIAWTFDPLMARNAYFNVAKLGGEVVRYYVDFYGPMTDAVNRGDQSDRVLVAWRLDDPRVGAACGRPGGRPATPDGSPSSSSPVLVVGADGGPERRPGPRPGAMAACQVPADISALRGERPEVAARWRRAVRDVLGGALAEGRRVTGVTRDGWYLLGPAAPGDVRTPPGAA